MIREIPIKEKSSFRESRRDNSHLLSRHTTEEQINLYIICHNTLQEKKFIHMEEDIPFIQNPI